MHSLLGELAFERPASPTLRRGIGAATYGLLLTFQSSAYLPFNIAFFYRGALILFLFMTRQTD